MNFACIRDPSNWWDKPKKNCIINVPDPKLKKAIKILRPKSEMNLRPGKKLELMGLAHVDSQNGPTNFNLQPIQNHHYACHVAAMSNYQCGLLKLPMTILNCHNRYDGPISTYMFMTISVDLSCSLINDAPFLMIIFHHKIIIDQPL
jgi:hypothetical protein